MGLRGSGSTSAIHTLATNRIKPARPQLNENPSRPPYGQSVDLPSVAAMKVVGHDKEGSITREARPPFNHPQAAKRREAVYLGTFISSGIILTPK
jgi:hypothetical protein